MSLYTKTLNNCNNIDYDYDLINIEIYSLAG